MYIVKTLASDIHPYRHPSDLTFICRDAEAKVQIQIQIP